MATARTHRRFGWIPDIEDHRDYQLTEHRPDLLPRLDIHPREALPAAVDLRSFCLPVEDQGQLGACTAFGSGNSVEVVAKKLGLAQFKISKLMQYYLTRLLEGTVQYDVGASVRDTMRAFAGYGFAHSSLWEYLPANFAVAPPATAIEDGKKNLATRYISVPNDTTQIKTILAAGYPVVIGFSVFQNFPMGSGVDLVPMPAGQIVGGHCVSLVGYNDADGTYLFRNSWGSTWGNGGYGRMPYAFLPVAARDFWMVSEITGTPIVPPTPTPTPVATKTHQIDVYSDGSYKVVI